MTQSGRNSVAVLFPGQGSQYVGMGRELAAMHRVARETFEQADAELGYKLSVVCFEGPEEKLKLTEITQPAILTVSVAAWRVLREKGVMASYAAGHSLGEYAAHVAAGTLRFEDALRTVRHRGKYMQDAVPVGTGAMAAILGMQLDELKKICAEAAHGQVCAPANINSPEQVVISGNAEAVQRAAELAKRHGAKRAVMLPVSAPFHCSLLHPAQDRMAQDLARLEFQRMQMPVVSNVDAALVDTPEQARDALVRQVTGAVQWERSMRAVIAHGAETFVEVGPGKVLCGLMRQIDRSRTCLNVEDEASLQKTLHHAKAQAGAL
jgi:[acyl-carrier-protein] S-malonyltransferase